MFSSKNESNKCVVVNKARIFSEFKMTKESANEINVANNKLKVEYDSVSYQYNNTQDGTVRLALSKKLESLQAQVENLNVTYREQETAKIWKRIQSYSSNYLDGKDYNLILGFENNGDVVGYKSKVDITDELLLYLNKRYEGNN